MDKNKIVMRILFLLIIVLVILLGYVFVFDPILTGYAIDSNIDAQAQGMEYVVVSLVNATAPPNCQAVPFTVGNTSVTLVAAECFEN